MAVVAQNKEKISFANENMNTAMKSKENVGFYLVDVNYGYANGITWQLDCIKEFVKNLRSQQERFYIYVYEQNAREVDYQTFMNIPIANTSNMMNALTSLFGVHLPKEKTNEIDFVFLTDGLEGLRDTFESQYNRCKQIYESAGGTLDCSGVFVLKGGKETATTQEIRRIFGSAIVCKPDTMAKNLQETQQGITQCNNAKKALQQTKGKIQVSINKAHAVAQKSQTEEAKKKREEICAKAQKTSQDTKAHIENTEKDINEIVDKQNDNISEANDNDNIDANDNDNDNIDDANDNDNIDDGPVERIDSADDDDVEQEGTLMKLFFTGQKVIKTLLEHVNAWTKLGGETYTLVSIKQLKKKKHYGGRKMNDDELGFSLKFSDEFDKFDEEDDTVENDERNTIGNFKKRIIAKLKKTLGITGDHISVADVREGSIIVDFIIDKYGVEQLYRKYVVSELDKQFEFIRKQIEEKNPFDINEKTEKEIKEEKTKNELIEFQNKLQNISNENNQIIDELNQSVEDALAAGNAAKEIDTAIAQFAQLESMLNNITISSVKKKVEKMKNNLAKSKNEILSVKKQLLEQKIDFGTTEMNEQINNLKQNTKQIQIVNEKIQKGIEHCENIISDEIKMRKDKWTDEIYEEFCAQKEQYCKEGNEEIDRTDKEFGEVNDEIDEMVENARGVVSLWSEKKDEDEDEDEDEKSEKSEVERTNIEAETICNDGTNMIQDIENKTNAIVTKYIYGSGVDDNEDNTVLTNTKIAETLKNADWGYELLSIEANEEQKEQNYDSDTDDSEDEKDDQKENKSMVYVLKFKADFDVICGENGEAEKFKTVVKNSIQILLNIDENSININNVKKHDEECVMVCVAITKEMKVEMKQKISIRSPGLSASASAVSFAPVIEIESKEQQEIRQHIKDEHPFDINDKTEKEIEQETNKNELIKIDNKFKDILDKSDKSINKLKQLIETEEKQIAISKNAMNKFDYLETSLNNMKTKWIQPKVDDMKNDLAISKNETIANFEQMKQELGIDKKKMNESISKLQKNKSNILTFKQKIEKGIVKCSNVIHNELEMRKSKWKKFVDKIFEKKKYGCEFEAMENITHKKNAKLLSMVILTKLNITITSATDLTLIVYKNGTNGECKPFGKIPLPGNAWILKCSKDEKYLIAACENKGKDGLIIIWDIPSLFEDMHIKYYIESKRGKISFRTPNAIAISNDNRYIFYCQNGAKISIIDLNKKKPKKIGEIGLVDIEDNGNWTITSISVSDNLLIFGSEHGTIGVFFLSLLQKPLKRAKSIKKFKSRRRTLSRTSTTMNFDFDNMYFAINLFQSTKQIIEDITISCDEKSVVICGKRRVQCLNIVLNKQTMNNLMKIKKSEEQLKIIKEIIKLEENAKIAAAYGKQARFNKKKPNIFCYCKDGYNGVTFKVYNMENNGSMLKLLDAKTTKGKKSSFGAQIQFMDKNNRCVIGYQTITNTYNGKIYNPPKCYVWKYKNKM